MAYWKCIIWAISDLPIIKSVCEKVRFTINVLFKMTFLNFCLLHFPKFQVTIVKNLMEKPSFFIMDFHGFNEVLLRHKYSWSTYFFQWNGSPFELFWNFHGVAFSLFFLNERNITSLLKNLSSSSINKSYLRTVEYAISFFFFDFLFTLFTISYFNVCLF